MPSRRVLLALALLAAGSPSAFAQGFRMPRVDVEHDAEADFATFKTYRWKDPASPAADPKAHVSIVWYVDRELRKKGLTKVAEGPADLFVRYYAKAREGLKGTPTQGESYLPGGTGSLSTGVDFRRVQEGTLIVELQRVSDEKPVWRAGTEWASVDKKRLDAEIETGVRTLFAKYPPPPATTPKP